MGRKIVAAPAVAVCFALGICWAKFLSLPFSLFFFPAALLFLACFFLRDCPTFDFNFLTLVVFLGAAHFSLYNTLSADHLINYNHIFAKQSFYLEGVVDDFPRVKHNRLEFGLRALALARAGDVSDLGGVFDSVSGRVLVRFSGFGGGKDYGRAPVYGERIILRGRFFRPRVFSDFDYREYLRRKGIYALFRPRLDAQVRVIADNQGNPVCRLSGRARAGLRKKAEALLGPVEASVLSAMLLGDRSGLPRGISLAFQRTGTAHILAISGMHIAILVFVLLVVLKAGRVPRKPRYILTILFLLFYAVMGGGRPSIVRAVVMAVIMLAGALLDKETDVYNSLAIAALVILSYNPFQLWDAGFQLSFVSVLFIVFLVPRLKRVVPGKNIAAVSLRVSLAAWLGTAWLVWHYFGIVSPIAILANLIIVPMVSGVVISGIIFLASLFIIPAAAPLFASALSLIITLLVKTALALSLIPGAYFVR